MKIGIVYNPNAGNSVFQKEAIKALKTKLNSEKLFCSASSHPFLKGCFPDIVCLGKKEAENSYQDSVNAGAELKEMDLVIVFGGDGTVADVVSGQRKTGKLIPIMGIGCGTANAGPLIFTSQLKALEKLDPQKLKLVYVNGLDVYDKNDCLIGTAFNDLVFSDCLVSTSGKTVVTVSAKEFLSGKRNCAEPSKIGTENTSIEINKKIVDIPFEIGQIILSPVYNKSSFACKAVFGKVCWLTHSDKDATMIVTKTPIIKITDTDDLRAENPVLLSQFIFGSKDRLKISGTKGFAIIDGNPRIDMEGDGAAAKIILNSTAALTVQTETSNSI